MTLPVSGAISLSDVNVELQRSATATISMNDAELRTLFAVPSGAIGLATGYGRANKLVISITSNQTNLDLRSWLISQGWNQTSNVEVTINSGVWVSSNSTGTPALNVSGSFPNGLKITNNGTIAGMGGAGGNAGSGAGSVGGTALQVSTACSVTNNNIIAGGGGGGGAGGNGGQYVNFTNAFVSGGGGGGGRSGLINRSGGSPNGGTGTSGGAGGGGGGGAANYVSGEYGQYQGTVYGGAGGSGGNWGAGGAGGGGSYFSGYWANYTSGGGGGGSGGKSVVGSGYITWLATGTRYGSVT